MKRLWKKVLALALVSTMTITLFGCGSSSKPAEATTQKETEKQTEKQAEAAAETTAAESGETSFEGQTLSVAIFQGGYGDAFWKDVIAKFEAEYGVTVDALISPSVGQQLQPRIASGDVPDFISIPLNETSAITKSLMVERALLPIDDVFESEALDKPGTKIKDLIIDGLLDSNNYKPYDDGKTYLAPFNIGPMGLIYDKNLFATKGWEVPETWEEFFALGDIAKAEGYALFTYPGEYPGYMESILWSAIAAEVGTQGVEDIVTEYKEGSFSTDAVKRALTNIQKIATDDYLLPGSQALNHTDSQSKFLLNQALFIPNGTWIINEMAEAEKAEGFEYAMTYSPVEKKGDTAYIMSSDEQFAILKDAKNPELAKEFLKFLYTDESVQAFTKYTGSLMSLKNASEVVKDVKAVDSDELAFSPELANMYEIFDKSTPLFVDYKALPAGSIVNLKTAIFKNSLPGVMTDSTTVDEWCEAVEDEMAAARVDIEAAK